MKITRNRQYGIGRSQPKGFTLIEVMIALLLLAIGAVSGFALLMIGVQQDAEASHYSTARAIVQQQLDYVRTLPYTGSGTTITASLGSTVNIPLSGSCPSSYVTSQTPSTALPSGTGTVTFTQQNTAGQKGLCLVAITVGWTEPGRGQISVTTNTYVSEGGINSL